MYRMVIIGALSVVWRWRHSVFEVTTEVTVFAVTWNEYSIYLLPAYIHVHVYVNAYMCMYICMFKHMFVCLFHRERIEGVVMMFLMSIQTVLLVWYIVVIRYVTMMIQSCHTSTVRNNVLVKRDKHTFIKMAPNLCMVITEPMKIKM